MKYPNLEKLVDIIAVLRSENGCEWDREQTHKSLRPNMLEEAYEAVDAIDEGDISNLREELGKQKNKPVKLYSIFFPFGKVVYGIPIIVSNAELAAIKLL